MPGGKCSFAPVHAPTTVIPLPELQHPLVPPRLQGCLGAASLWKCPALGLDWIVVRRYKYAYGGKRNFAVTAFGWCLSQAAFGLGSWCYSWESFVSDRDFIALVLRWKPNCHQDHILSPTNPWWCISWVEKDPSARKPYLFAFGKGSDISAVGLRLFNIRGRRK